MKVFADFHHMGLYNSLHFLFEERLGWELYRPIGEDWATAGYWKLAEPYGNNPVTIKQFLGIDNHKWDAYSSLNGNYKLKDDVYNIYNPTTENHEKAITLDTFKQMHFDIIISSYQPHDYSFKELRDKYQPQAKLISQMGNIWQVTEIKNVMCSTVPYDVPPDVNAVFYHQEFSLDTFKYIKPDHRNSITNFVNLHPAYEIYDQYKSLLPDYTFKSYGVQCPDGIISGEKKLAGIMADSAFGFHVKPNGDGYGHIVHNWYACGRPVITNGSDYIDKLAGDLFIDDKTYINLERGTVKENIDKIRYWSIPEHHDQMCQNAYDRFKEVVDFDEEEIRIRDFLDHLI